jgi:hypothetical protein
MKFAILLFVLGALGWGATRVIGRSEVGSDKAQTTYYASGQMEARFEYADGRRQGPAERWHPNGTRMAEGRYEDGHMEGAWRFWNADGTSDNARTGIYHGGERISGLEADTREARGE